MASSSGSGRKRRARLPGYVAPIAKWLAPRIAFVGVGVLIAYFVFSGPGGESESALPAPDTPPPEYLYLDTKGVLAYLGQVSGGLSPTEKRALAVTDTKSGKATAGPAGEVGRTVQKEQRTEEVVTPTAADRFYRLLRFLRAGESPTPEGSRPWIRDIDVALSDSNSAEDVRRSIIEVREGDFVRLQDVHLALPPYAAIFPRTTYADSYLGSLVASAPRTLYAPTSQQAAAAVTDYIKAIGRNPVLPFVVRTSGLRQADEHPVTFFIPAQYRALLSAPRLLLGKLTVVGKVVYREGRVLHGRLRAEHRRLLLLRPTDGCALRPGAQARLADRASQSRPDQEGRSRQCDRLDAAWLSGDRRRSDRDL